MVTKAPTRIKEQGPITVPPIQRPSLEIETVIRKDETVQRVEVEGQESPDQRECCAQNHAIDYI